MFECNLCYLSLSIQQQFVVVQFEEIDNTNKCFAAIHEIYR